jgi:hypothetical protein
VTLASPVVAAIVRIGVVAPIVVIGVVLAIVSVTVPCTVWDSVCRCVLAAIVSVIVPNGVLAAIDCVMVRIGVADLDSVIDGDGGLFDTERVPVASGVAVTAGIGHVSGGRIPPATTQQLLVSSSACSATS